MDNNINSGVSSIIKDIMHEFGYTNVKEFAKELDCNYMMLYYHYAGRNNEMSSELAKKILARYPNMRREFVMHGEMPMFKGQEIPIQESFHIPSESVSTGEIFKLLERITTLLEKVQAREAIIDEKIKHLESLEKSVSSSCEQKENRAS